ncbi:cytochrome P450 [Halovenus rubra]|uniref:Cytochrome P450 n=2 Tax=Halovenus rubra TaxID=869890 RepID=A0ABD5X8A6_9EURY|nr:cytochrome P450 [Halovenus rubra]
MNNPPTAPGRQPVIGHTLHVLRSPLTSLQQWGQTDESLVRVRIANQQLSLITSPDAVREVLTAESDRYKKADIVRDRLGTLQGNSLVLLEGEKWSERRKLLQEGFGSRGLTDAGSLMTTYAREVVDGWTSGTSVPVVDAARSLVLAVLAKALFGLDLRGEQTPIHEAAGDILSRLDVRSVSLYLPEWVPTPTNIRFRRAVSTLHDRLDTIVEQQNEPPAESLLGLMRASGLAAEEIRDELIALLFAGYDSTATALACTLGLLGNHRDVQSALGNELDAVVDDRPPTPSELPELPLLDAIIKESLRLYPPQYLIFREPTTETTVGGYQVPAGATIVVPPWILHRDPTVWEKPSTFRPERWLGSTPDRPEYAYIPYGGGPRYCLGATMADRVLKLTVAVICQQTEFHSPTPVSVTAGPTLSVDETLKLQIK